MVYWAAVKAVYDIVTKTPKLAVGLGLCPSCYRRRGAWMFSCETCKVALCNHCQATILKAALTQGMKYTKCPKCGGTYETL
jgi:hypothetical protein